MVISIELEEKETTKIHILCGFFSVLLQKPFLVSLQ